MYGRNLSAALMRSCFRNRARDRGDEPIRLGLVLGHPDMEKDYLTLKRAPPARPSGEGKDDDYDVLAHGEAVGRIFKANAAPVGLSWMWMLFTTKASQPTHGYEATREAAMTAFAKSWRLE
jgi:hypothetical protein